MAVKAGRDDTSRMSRSFGFPSSKITERFYRN